MSTSTDEDTVRELLRRAVEEPARGVAPQAVERRARALRARRRAARAAAVATAAGAVAVLGPLLRRPGPGSGTPPLAMGPAGAAGAGQLSVTGLVLALAAAVVLAAAVGTAAWWWTRRRLRRWRAAGRPVTRRRVVAAWSVTGAVVAAALLAASTLTHLAVADRYVTASVSMGPTLHAGDQLLVDTWHGADGLHRGDVVVFRAPPSWLPPAAPADTGTAAALRAAGRLTGLDVQNGPGTEPFLVKRVIGLPGDRVVCCDLLGRLSVNGAPLDEPYLRPGVPPSDVRFDATVAAGRLWVLGDDRPESADSRRHRGDGGDGGVPAELVVGRAVAVVWPLDRFGGVVAPR